MSNALALPTRHDEDFRYADLAALEPLWPVAVERIVVAPGESGAKSIVLDAPNDVARAVEIELGAGAKFDLRLLSIGGGYGRIALSATLGEGADFTFGAAQLGGDRQTLETVTTVTHAAPNATSRQTIRSVLAGHATGTYLGKVAVARGADGTDAGQSVRAMLLDRTATANANTSSRASAAAVSAASSAAPTKASAMNACNISRLASAGGIPRLAM